jgi:hypothetical protein
MSSKSWIVVSMIALVAVALAPTLNAQMAPDGEGGWVKKMEAPKLPRDAQLATPKGFGLNQSILQIPASSFMPRFLGDQLDYYSNGYMENPNAAAGFYQASVFLPAGSNVTWLDLYSYDVDAANDITAYFRCYSGGDYAGNPPTFSEIATVSSTGDGGYAYTAASTGGYTINNNVAYEGGCQYQIGLSMFQNHAFKGVDLWWERVVSPAPAVATFGDVPTDHAFFQYVEALVDSGITGGCGGGNYCPNDPITRGQMAVFLSAALGLYHDIGF